MRRIPLTQGQFAMVDDDRYDELSQWKWYAHCHHGNIYVARKIKQRYLAMHRYLIKAEMGQQVDHEDNNGLNNQISNLRLCSNGQNQQNRHIVRGRSKYKGVSWDKTRSKWLSRIQVNGKRFSIGHYEKESDAAKAYDYMARQLCGQFACCNFALCA